MRFSTYLRADNPHDRKDHLAELTALDGITPEIVLKLIRCLPPTIDPVEMRPAVAATLKVAGRDSEERPTYMAIVPPEYDWRHSYPDDRRLTSARSLVEGGVGMVGGNDGKTGSGPKAGLHCDRAGVCGCERASTTTIP